jgi:chorismate dehydratase
LALKTPRFGCVKYLNARPLIHDWPGPVTFDYPSTLCAQLARGEIDIALVSSFEFLRNPVYRIVDDVCIASDGPVYSVVLAHAGELSEIEEIKLDPTSETSVNLLRCFLAERGLKPRVVPGSASCQPFVDGSLPATPIACLLIGDHAICFRQQHENEFHFWDLGEAWKKLIGLPFVYALWLIRPDVADATTIARNLRALRDQNLRNIDNLVSQQTRFPPDFCRRYYRENLRFNFGEREKRGLRAFADLCARHGLLAQGDLVFDTV